MVLRPVMFAVGMLCLVLVTAQSPVGGENLGIPLAQQPIPFDKCSIAASNDGDMKLTAVAWGYNNEYWVAKQTNNWGKWEDFQSLGGFFAGGPTVIRNANNDLVVFGRGADKKVWYKVLDGNDDNEWVLLGGKLLSPRVTALLDSQGLIHLFVQGRDSAIWEKRQYANGTEAVWGEWVSLGGIFTSNVAAVLDPESIIHVFARGVDGKMWNATQTIQDDGSVVWTSWGKSDDSVFLSSSATITARLNAQGLIEVIARGADKAFWHTRQTVNDDRGVTWSPFKSLGGIFAGPAISALNSDSLLTVFGRGPDKGVWYKQQSHHPVDSPSDSWSKWNPLGGRFSVGADVILDTRGFVNVFGRGLDSSIWHRGQTFNEDTKSVGFFDPWTKIPGRFRPFAC